MAGGGAGLGAGNPEYLQRVMGGASSGVNRLPESRAERSAKAAPQARQQAQQAQQAPQPQVQQAELPAQGAPALAATTLAPEAQDTGPVIPEGFRRARGDYQFGPGTVGRYNGQYVFKDPVTNQYLATRNQADAYLRAFGTDGNALTSMSNRGYTTGNNIAGMPQSTISSGKDLISAMRPSTPFAIGTQGPGLSKDVANQLYTSGSQYANSQRAFQTLYDKLLEGTFKGQDIEPIAKYLQDYSKQANEAMNQYSTLANKHLPRSNSMAGAGGGVQERFMPQQRFTLPPETWNMKPKELMRWIENYEKKMGKDSFMGNAAWVVGPALIGGAAATGITGVTGPSVVNSAIGSGIENLTGMTSKASGGIVNLLRSKS